MAIISTLWQVLSSSREYSVVALSMHTATASYHTSSALYPKGVAVPVLPQQWLKNEASTL